MSVMYIALSVIIGLVVLAGVFYINYMMESLKQRKASAYARAIERSARYQHFLDFFKADQLPKEVRLILIEEIESQFENVHQLGAGDGRSERLLEQAKEQHKAILNLPEKPPKIIKSLDLAAVRETQQQIKNLFKVLRFIGQTKKKQTKAVNKNLKVLQNLYVETGVSAHTAIAEAAAAQSRNKLALHHLNQAAAEYARSDAKKFAQQIRDLRNQIANIEKQVKDTPPPPAPKPEQPAPQQAAEEKLKSRGLDRMFDQQASMKAKKRL